MKTVYILFLMTCLSVFSAAEQTGKECNNISTGLINGKSKREVKEKEQIFCKMGPEFSALNFFIINF